MERRGVKPKLRPVLSTAEREMMMAVVLRNPVVFATFKDQLKVGHFSPLDAKYGVLWEVTTKYYNKWEKLPGQKILQAEVQSILDDMPELLNDTEIDDLFVFIKAIYNTEEWDEDLTTSESYAQWATEKLKLYLEDRLAAEVGSRLQTDGCVVVDLPQALASLKDEAEQVASIGIISARDFLSPSWDKDGGLNIQLFPTNIAFLDKFLGGGQAPGEVYGIMGPFGSCKTTLAVMLIVEGAKYAYNHRMENAEHDYYAFIFSYEATLPELRIRCVSYAAEVHRKSLETMGNHGIRALSTSKALKSYEQTRFRQLLLSGKAIPGEQHRVRRVERFLKDRIIAVDMTGYDPERRGAGSGYIEEIARIISAELRRRGPKARALLVVVDYVGAMVRRTITNLAEDSAQMRHLITAAPLKARNMIANQYNCPIWLIHQLSGEANRKNPGARYHHTDAAESKSFAENLDFCFVVGNLTDNGLGQIVATKHRREAAMAPQVIKVDGAFSRVDYPDKEFVVDPQTRSIKEKDLLQSTVVTLGKNKRADDDFIPLVL